LEAIMKCGAIAIVALVSVLSTVWAQTAESARRKEVVQDNNASKPPRPDFVQNASDCAPGEPRAVWASKVVVGYACYYSSDQR
jgi:hypothetical protein